MRSVWTRAVFSFGQGGKPPNSGHTKPPQKAIASAAGFCKSGILTSLLLQLQFLEGPLRRVFFFRSSGFLQLLPQDRPESEWPRPSLPEYPRRGKHNATKKCSSKLYNYDQRTARTCDLGRRSEKADQPRSTDSIFRTNNCFCTGSSA